MHLVRPRKRHSSWCDTTPRRKSVKVDLIALALALDSRPHQGGNPDPVYASADVNLSTVLSVIAIVTAD